MAKQRKKKLPKKTSFLFTRVDEELGERAKKRAFEMHETPSNWLRKVVRAAVDGSDDVARRDEVLEEAAKRIEWAMPKANHQDTMRGACIIVRALKSGGR